MADVSLLSILHLNFFCKWRNPKPILHLPDRDLSNQHLILY
jgi:hypothetical protein